MSRASRITAHCTTGKSWLRIDSTRERGHAGPREHRLGDDGAAQELAELQSQHGDHRDARVAEGVLADRLEPRPAPWPAPS